MCLVLLYISEFISGYLLDILIYYFFYYFIGGSDCLYLDEAAFDDFSLLQTDQLQQQNWFSVERLLGFNASVQPFSSK